MEPTSDNDHWNALFARERDRVLAALRPISDGGIVERADHVGTTSVPGLAGRPVVDVALAVWPFPLTVAARQALETLGYQLDPYSPRISEQRFRHISAPFQLFLAEAGSLFAADHVLLRDYLRHDDAARDALSARKREWADKPDSQEYREAKGQWFDDLLDNAHQSWIEREQFTPLHRVAEELRDMPCPWYIAGGWALDLFVGRVRRVHLDVDVIVPRADQLALREHMTARGWTLLTPLDERYEPWPAHMRLEPPRHQAHAFRGGAMIDLLLTDLDGAWHFRREPTIIRDLSRIGLQSLEGITFLAPELVLLFKSANTSGRERINDQRDFEGTYASLEPERRAWLRWALTAAYPSHTWIERL